VADDTINVPPFPPLRWDEFFWVGEITLPSWAGFQTRRGPYAGISSVDPSDGTVRLSVAVEDRQPHTQPTQAQARAYQHLLDNEAVVCAEVLLALFRDYPEQQANYGDDPLPDIDEPAGLKALLGLSQVHVLFESRDDVAYVGFEFGCVWDEEHGAGVMTHLGRIVEIGPASASFLWTIAQRDAADNGRSSA